MVCERAERSIITKYRQLIWRPFIKGIQEYEQVLENDRIAVCLSGGKDSFLLAKCLQELNRFSKVHFELVYMLMDPGYLPETRQTIEENASLLNIPLTVFNADIFESVSKIENPCYICARMRRGYLYKHAQSAGCNKIALGHHFDDVIETILLAMFYAGEIRAMPPKLKSKNFEGMQLIRPLYQVREQSILLWKNYIGLQFEGCGCTVERSDNGSKRAEVKELLARLRKENPVIEKNIFKSIGNVQLDTLLGYKQINERHGFLDRF
jgi:tRNA(Ile)-lysidine synthase TilS/MesJ